MPSNRVRSELPCQESGQTVMEYALVVALISVGALVALTGIGLDVVSAAADVLAGMVS